MSPSGFARQRTGQHVDAAHASDRIGADSVASSGARTKAAGVLTAGFAILGSMAKTVAALGGRKDLLPIACQGGVGYGRRAEAVPGREMEKALPARREKNGRAFFGVVPTD